MSSAWEEYLDSETWEDFLNSASDEGEIERFVTELVDVEDIETL